MDQVAVLIDTRQTQPINEIEDVLLSARSSPLCEYTPNYLDYAAEQVVSLIKTFRTVMRVESKDAFGADDFLMI